MGENEMNHKAVEKLENKLEDAIAEVFKAMNKKKIPIVPDHHTLKMMAKAATAVYEAVVENGKP
jgi:hypothetical protein